MKLKLKAEYRYDRFILSDTRFLYEKVIKALKSGVRHRMQF